jgi:pyruvate,water dikinase
MLLNNGSQSPPAALLALGELARGRADGLSDAELVLRAPVVLALIPPSISPSGELPPVEQQPSSSLGGLDRLGARDALRLRSRWLQELLVRAVRTLGVRFETAYGLPRPELIGEMTWREVVAAVNGHPLPRDLATRAAEVPGPPLPTAFRLTTSGAVVHSSTHRGSSIVGIAAGGGRGVGEARHRVGVDGTSSGIVLVTRHLEPQLAPLLPSLDGLVSETGSALSHLAILAREMKVPTVAGVEGATVRFPPGTRLLVDGDVGEVEVLATASQPVEQKETKR